MVDEKWSGILKSIKREFVIDNDEKLVSSIQTLFSKYYKKYDSSELSEFGYDNDEYAYETYMKHNPDIFVSIMRALIKQKLLDKKLKKIKDVV